MECREDKELTRKQNEEKNSQRLIDNHDKNPFSVRSRKLCNDSSISKTVKESFLLRILEKVPKHIDEICAESNMPAQRAGSIWPALELKGLAAQLPGKYFVSIIRQ